MDARVLSNLSLWHEVPEGQSRVPGEEDPDTLTRENDLAQGDLEEAEHFNRDVLGRRIKALGEEHPDTLTATLSARTTKAEQVAPGSTKNSELLVRDSSEKPSQQVAKNPKGNVPNPALREKLLTGCTDNLCFLIKSSEHLARLDLVRQSGFQPEVHAFLVDPNFEWTSLSVIRMLACQRSANYGIFNEESDILGVVAIKSSTTTPLKISVGVWLQKLDVRVLRRIVSQVVLQVFGRSPMYREHDVRRNSFTLSREGVNRATQIEAQIICFIKDDGSQGSKKVQETQVPIDLKRVLGTDGCVSLKTVFQSSNLKLTGQEQDFLDLGERVAMRFKSRPDIPRGLRSAKAPKSPTDSKSDVLAGSLLKKTLPDYRDSHWRPGNLFKCILSKFSCNASEPDWRKSLDGHIVVQLPSHDCDGNLLPKEDEVLVARVDTEPRPIYSVARIALHPIEAVEMKDVSPKNEPHEPVSMQHQQPSSEDSPPQKVRWGKQPDCLDYLQDTHEYEVLVKSPKKWETAHLCTEVVRRGTCMVRFKFGVGEESRKHSRLKLVEASDLRLSSRFKRRTVPDEAEAVPLDCDTNLPTQRDEDGVSEADTAPTLPAHIKVEALSFQM